MSLEHLGGPFPPLVASTERKDEETRTSASSATAGASTTHRSYVEDASGDEDLDGQRSVNPSPSTQAHRQEEADVVDLTSDDPPDSGRSTTRPLGRRRAAATAAAESVEPAISAASSAAPASEYTFPGK